MTEITPEAPTTFEGVGLFVARYQVQSEAENGESLTSNEQGLFLAPGISEVLDALHQMHPQGVTVYEVQLAHDGADLVDARDEWKRG